MEDQFRKAAEDQMRADLSNNIIVKEQTSLPAVSVPSSNDRSILLGGILVAGILLMVGLIGGITFFQGQVRKEDIGEAIVRTLDTESKQVDTSVVPTVPLREEYKNPFNESTAYVNPFSQDYNPFVLLDEGY